MRPVGPDISKWQGNNLETHPDIHGVDFVTLHNKSDFIILRAGYGGSGGGAFLDERVHQFMSTLGPILRNNPKPFTFYWYFRDDVNVMDQVNLFSMIINQYKTFVNLTPIVDAEVFVKSDLVSTQKIIDFQTEVERQTGLLVDTLYGRAYQLNQETTPGLPEVLPNLHVARYADIDEQTEEPWEEGSNVDPRDYDDWVYWQYTAKGPGGEYGVVSASIDLNVFNGTLEELRELAGLHEPNEPPPTFDGFGTKVEERVVTAPGFAEFDIEEALPEAIYFAFGKGEVKEIAVWARVEDTEIKLGRKWCSHRNDWLFEFPSWVGKGIPIIAELVDKEGPTPVVIAFVYEVW